MKIYNITVWMPSQVWQVESKASYYARGCTKSFDYLIVFDSELDMYKNLYEGIYDEDGYQITISVYGKGSGNNE